MIQTSRVCVNAKVIQHSDSVSELAGPCDLPAQDTIDRPLRRAQWQNTSKDQYQDLIRGTRRYTRLVVCGKRVDEQEARAQADSGICVCVVPHLVGGGGGMSVRHFLCVCVTCVCDTVCVVKWSVCVCIFLNEHL
jgi:hypothetical protein